MLPDSAISSAFAATRPRRFANLPAGCTVAFLEACESDGSQLDGNCGGASEERARVLVAARNRRRVRVWSERDGQGREGAGDDEGARARTGRVLRAAGQGERVAVADLPARRAILLLVPRRYEARRRGEGRRTIATRAKRCSKGLGARPAVRMRAAAASFWRTAVR